MPGAYLCEVDDVPEEQPCQVHPKGLEAIALHRVGEAIYATSDQCSHMEASLAEFGYIEGCIVECTLHGCKFDVRTGEPDGHTDIEALVSYPIVIEDGKIYLRDAI